jgi:hypothetical protein
MFIGEATNTNFIVFGLTQSGLELTIYHTRWEHANHYITDAVLRNRNSYIDSLMVFNATFNNISVMWKRKDWLAWNQDNMSEWGDMSIRGLLFQLASTIKIQLRVLV